MAGRNFRLAGIVPVVSADKGSVLRVGSDLGRRCAEILNLGKQSPIHCATEPIIPTPTRRRSELVEESVPNKRSGNKSQIPRLRSASLRSAWNDGQGGRARILG